MGGQSLCLGREKKATVWGKSPAFSLILPIPNPVFHAHMEEFP